MSNVTSSSIQNNSDYKDLLGKLEYEIFLDEKIPVVVFLAFLSIIGTIGNLHALLVYSLRYTSSNHRTFVVWLAAIDFVACFLGMPFEIFDARYSYTFTATGACKLFRFINHVSSVGSGIFLGVIAVERFRKACHPLRRQLGTQGAKIACIITMLSSIVISIPSFIVYGTSSKELAGYPGVEVFGCKVMYRYKNSAFFKAYNVFLLLLSTGIFLLGIIMYSFVGRSLYKQMVFRIRAQSTRKGPRPPLSKENSSQITPVEEESSSLVASKNVVLRTLSSLSRRSNSSKPKMRLDRTRRITLMFLVATAVSYVGYLPNSIILIIQAVSPHVYRNIAEHVGTVMPILLRLYFLSNVTNPIVYCFMDDRFRRECKALYRKLMFWK